VPQKKAEQKGRYTFMFIFLLATLPTSHGCFADIKVFLYFIVHFIYIKTFLLNHSIYLKKTALKSTQRILMQFLI
jgi:hypothetical protein